MIRLVGISTGFGGIVLYILLLAACTGQPAGTLPISINEVMVAAVDHAAHEIWNAPVEERSPKTEKDWTELEHHAIQLVASSRTVLLAGTGKGDATWIKSPDWIKDAQALTDASTAALNGVRSKDMNAISAAGDRLVMACEDCHKTFKPEIPSEGKFHPHYRR